MSAFRIRFDVDVEADDISAAGDIAVAVYERVGQAVREVEGVRWMLPVADIKPREPFAVPAGGAEGDTGA